MALSETKIAGLKELARRGIGGERDNARAILERNGIKWDEEPKQQKKGTGTGSGPKYSKGGPNTYTSKDKDFDDFFKGFWDDSPRPDMNNDPFFNHKLRIPGVNSDFKLTVLSVVVSKLYGPSWKIVFQSMGEYAHIPGLGAVEHSVIRESYERNYTRLVDAAKKGMDNTTLY